MIVQEMVIKDKMTRFEKIEEHFELYGDIKKEDMEWLILTHIEQEEEIERLISNNRQPQKIG